MPAGAKRTVLIVDDESDIRSSLKILIEAELPHVKVMTASTGMEGLRIMGQEPVHLILSDYRMPGMDGFEFLAAAHKVSPGTPTIMMTAYPDPSIAARAVSELGVGLFIAKPFDLDYLVKVVSTLADASAKKMASEQPATRSGALGP